MPFAATWMDLEISILSEVKPDREREISYDVTYMWNLKQTNKQTKQMNLFPKQKEAHRQKTNLWLPNGKGG